MAGREIALSTEEIGDQPPRFLDDKRARRHIPGFQMKLPESVESARGDMTEVEGRGTGSPHPPTPKKEILEQNEVLVDVLLNAEGESGAEQGLTESGNL